MNPHNFIITHIFSKELVAKMFTLLQRVVLHVHVLVWINLKGSMAFKHYTFQKYNQLQYSTLGYFGLQGLRSFPIQ